MDYQKSVSSHQVFSVVDGKKRHAKNVMVRENNNEQTKFMRHIEIDNKSRSVIGHERDGKVTLLTRRINGDKVNYSQNSITNIKNLRNKLRKSLSFSKPKRSGKAKPKRSGKGKPKRSGKGKPKRSGKGKPKRSGKGKPKRSGKAKPKRSGKGKGKTQKKKKSSSK